VTDHDNVNQFIRGALGRTERPAQPGDQAPAQGGVTQALRTLIGHASLAPPSEAEAAQAQADATQAASRAMAGDAMAGGGAIGAAVTPNPVAHGTDLARASLDIRRKYRNE